MTLTKRYWIAAGFLLVDFLFSMAMYAPNVFMVPYAKEIGLKVSEGILILAFISPGGFVGSVGFGLATSKVKFFKQSMIFIMAACALVLSILQIIPLFFESLYSLLAYSTLYGFAMNATVTLSLSTVGQLLTSESVEKGIAILVACDGIALLVSGPAIGEQCTSLHFLMLTKFKELSMHNISWLLKCVNGTVRHRSCAGCWSTVSKRSYWNINNESSFYPNDQHVFIQLRFQVFFLIPYNSVNTSLVITNRLLYLRIAEDETFLLNRFYETSAPGPALS